MKKLNLERIENLLKNLNLFKFLMESYKEIKLLIRKIIEKLSHFPLFSILIHILGSNFESIEWMLRILV